MRSRYEGVLQIIRFNWPFYAGSAVLVAAALAVFPWAAIPLLYWTCASLWVSHLVYDRSKLYEFGWLQDAPKRWLNLHAGLDESTEELARQFGRGASLDIFDRAQMTEPSMMRARQFRNAPAPNADWRALPLRDGAVDTVLLIFVAHELRAHEARAKLFQEAARVLRNGGEIVLVEHLRSWANFVAFGPGFLHFFSKRAWLRAAGEAGLQMWRTFSVTPFVQVMILRSEL